MNDDQWVTPATDGLFEAILTLQSLDDARKFFRDLLTEAEIKEFANRWQVANLLNQKVPYSTIEKRTGMSTTTIARISKWLQSGMGGYKLMLKKQNHHHGPA